MIKSNSKIIENTKMNSDISALITQRVKTPNTNYKPQLPTGISMNGNWTRQSDGSIIFSRIETNSALRPETQNSYISEALSDKYEPPSVLQSKFNTKLDKVPIPSTYSHTREYRKR